MKWYAVGARPPCDLIAARLELHHAIQLPAIAIGKALIPARGDDSHTAIIWRPDAGQWVTDAIPDSDGLRAGLCPTELTLTLGRDAAPAARSLSLIGVTRAEAIEWLRDGIWGEGLDSEAVCYEPHFDLPPHPVADRGEPFRNGMELSASELGRYFTNADHLLAEVASREGEATPILTWPHHFDIGRSLPAGPAGDPFAKSVGIGLSAGDDRYPEPYFYVNASPAPVGAELPPLPCGHWHTDGFLAAVLTATELLDRASNNEQQIHALQFLEAAIAAARSLLARSAEAAGKISDEFRQDSAAFSRECVVDRSAQAANRAVPFETRQPSTRGI